VLVDEGFNRTYADGFRFFETARAKTSRLLCVSPFAPVFDSAVTSTRNSRPPYLSSSRVIPLSYIFLSVTDSSFCACASYSVVVGQWRMVLWAVLYNGWTSVKSFILALQLYDGHRKFFDTVSRLPAGDKFRDELYTFTRVLIFSVQRIFRFVLASIPCNRTTSRP